MPRIPNLCWHKSNRRYYVTLNGVQVYLCERLPGSGKPNATPMPVVKAYEDAIREHLSNRKELPDPIGSDPTINELWLGYCQHVQSHYVKHGKPTSEVQTIRDACRVVAQLHGTLKAREFTPGKLREVRQVYVEKDWNRDHINKQVSRVRNMFAWAVSFDLIQESVHRGLELVPPLAKGRPAWPNGPVPREGKRIKPVESWAVARTVPFLPETLRPLVVAHWWIGCRASEACMMHTSEFEVEHDLLKWSPRQHKTEHHEDTEPLVYRLGPNAQLAILPRLLPALLPPVLPKSPRDRSRYWSHFGPNPGPVGWLFPVRGRGRHSSRGAGHWTRGSYRQAVARGIRLANKNRAADEPIIPHWSPLQIRHARATIIRDLHPKGAEASQAALRHKQLSTTEIYAEISEELARDVARRFG
jgi:integrase